MSLNDPEYDETPHSIEFETGYPDEFWGDGDDDWEAYEEYYDDPCFRCGPWCAMWCGEGLCGWHDLHHVQADANKRWWLAWLRYREHRSLARRWYRQQHHPLRRSHRRAGVRHMPTILLVSCVSKKADVPLPARDLYRSTWFRYARRYAELVTARPGDRWFILSAKYGLVDPDEVIYPYNQTLTAASVKEQWQWGAEVYRDWHLKFGDRRVRFVFLTGKHYSEHLVEWFALDGNVIETPLAGLGIGKQVAWLKGEVERLEQECKICTR